MWKIIYLGRWSLCGPLEGCWDFLWEASWLTWRRDTGTEEGRILGGMRVGLQQRGYRAGSRGRGHVRELCVTSSSEGTLASWRERASCFMLGCPSVSPSPLCTPPSLPGPFREGRKEIPALEQPALVSEAGAGSAFRNSEHNRKGWNAQGGGAGKPEKPKGSPESELWEGRKQTPR